MKFLLALLFLIIIVPAHLHAQRRQWYGSGQANASSPMLIGFRYDNSNQKNGNQMLLEFAFLPNVSETSVLRESQIKLLPLALGGRFLTEGINFRFRAALLEGDIYRDPLSFGLTLIDYDRSSVPDLYARWLNLRAGLGTTAGDDNFAVLPRVIANAGLSSLQLGELRFAELLPNAAETQFGFDAGGLAVVSLRFSNRAAFSIEAGYQSLFASSQVSRVLLGVQGSVSFVNPFGGVELYFRYDEQWTRIESVETKPSNRISRVEAGLQFIFGRKESFR
ncbi:MAG: hypothetical protein IAF08_11890 [Rhizobacter sp.]|nr:hypothetical protein [Chlorobiales bacterium]